MSKDYFERPHEKQRGTSIPRKLQVASLVLAAFSTGIAVGSRLEHEDTQARAASTETTTTVAGAEPTTTEDQSPSDYPRPDDIRIGEFPERLDVALGDQLVRVDGLGNCTGMIVNGYLLSASHCMWNKNTGEGGGQIVIRHWQDGFESVAGEASLWALDKPADLLLAKLSNESDLSHGWFVPSFSDTSPRIGTRFGIASLPGDAKKPFTGHLTLIGEIKESQNEKHQFVLALDNDNDEADINKLCQPGASGAMITDGYGNIGVLTGVWAHFGLDGKPNDSWDDARSRVEDQYKVDLSRTSMVCYASVVDRTKINTLIAALG